MCVCVRVQYAQCLYVVNLFLALMLLHDDSGLLAVGSAWLGLLACVVFVYF